MTLDGSTDPGRPTIPCPACSQDVSRDLVCLESVPVFCNVPQPSHAAALDVERADIRLSACKSCGHVYNREFNAERVAYAVGYENALDCSPRFRQYADALVHRMDEECCLPTTTAIEFGCGDGAFLRRLSERGATCVGFDPSYSGPPSPDRQSRFRIVRSFDPRDAGIESADLALSRHVLEHLPEPVELVHTIASFVAGRPRGRVYLEVPNGLATIRDLGIWDLIYEHVSYFWEGSLRRVLARAGLEPVEVAEDFGGQFLRAFAKVRRDPTFSQTGGSATPEPGTETLEPLLEAFADEFARKRTAWEETLIALVASGKRAIVWGAGSKGVTFLNVFLHVAPVELVVDLNPKKHGLFVAGSGQEIVAPERLTSYRPDAVIVMNPIYAQEIGAHCADLGLTAEILTA